MSEGVVMSDVMFEIDGHAGIVRLDRERAINALTPGMIQAIGTQLTAWALDDAVRMVLFEGKGARGFCAGGDVRQVRQMLLDGQRDAANAFFAAEYDVNKQIATYAKPIVSLMHGVVMGGGIGLGGHARYRFAAQSARFAMPESIIGFFPDVGARLLLAKAERHRALMHMLRGDAMGVGDAVALNLVDYVFADERQGDVRTALIGAAGAEDTGTAIEGVAARFRVAPGVHEQCDFADRHRDLVAADHYWEMPFVTYPADTIADMGEVGEMILSRCPMSQAVSVMALDAALSGMDIDGLFAQELALAEFMARRTDFAEGVRALLVDKDKNPRWTQLDFTQTDRGELAELAVLFDR